MPPHLQSGLFEWQHNVWCLAVTMTAISPARHREIDSCQAVHELPTILYSSEMKTIGNSLIVRSPDAPSIAEYQGDGDAQFSGSSLLL